MGTITLPSDTVVQAAVINKYGTSGERVQTVAGQKFACYMVPLIDAVGPGNIGVLEEAIEALTGVDGSITRICMGQVDDPFPEGFTPYLVAEGGYRAVKAKAAE